MSLQQIREQNDRYRDQIRNLLQARPLITAHAIAKSTGIEKALLRELLLYMPGVRRNEDRVPKYHWIDPAPPRPRRRVIPSVAFHNWMTTHPRDRPPYPLTYRIVDNRVYVYLPDENPDTAPCINADISRMLEERARALVNRQRREAREATAVAALETLEVMEAEEGPEPECICCGLSGRHELMDCREGFLCYKCADDIDPASGKRRRDL